MREIEIETKATLYALEGSEKGIYEYGRQAIWDEFGRCEYYQNEVRLYSDGRAEDFDDWYRRHYTSFPDCMSRNDFLAVYGDGLAGIYEKELKRAIAEKELNRAIAENQARDE